MTGQELIALMHGQTSGKPIAGFSAEAAVRQAIEEAWAIDVAAYLREGGFFATTAGQLTYTFEEIFGAFAGRVRKCRGVYEASLIFSGDFDQSLLLRRVYSDREALLVDNVERLVTFRDDPGDTTETYRADYYLAPPVYSATAQLPVLPGWHTRLILNGALAYWEMLRDRKPGTFRALFDSWLAEYPAALDAGSGLPTYGKTGGLAQPRVKPR